MGDFGEFMYGKEMRGGGDECGGGDVGVERWGWRSDEGTKIQDGLRFRLRGHCVRGLGLYMLGGH